MKIFPQSKYYSINKNEPKKKKKIEPKNSKVPSSHHLKNLHISYLTHQFKLYYKEIKEKTVQNRTVDFLTNDSRGNKVVALRKPIYRRCNQKIKITNDGDQ